MPGLVLSESQRLDWLRLIRSESIGPRSFRALVNRHGGAGAALLALPEIARAARRDIRICSQAEAERELAAAHRLGVRFVAMGEADYPLALQAIDSAPPLLAVRGNAASLNRPCVGIVGSRNASAVGLKFTEKLARDLGEAGFAIVSGLARGIDTAAHGASLQTGTIAVLAGGQDRIYPPQNGGLLDKLLENGCAISEMPMGWEARGRDFPRRNRLVSGLSLGLVVVEAARRSGSLITARFALEQGREVFAVPGSPLDPRAEGTNDLIRNGASLCGQASHVIDQLSPLVGRDPGHDRQLKMFDPGPPLVETGPLWDELLLDGVEPAPSLAEREDGGTYARIDASSGPGLGQGAGDRDESARRARQRILDLLGPVPILIDDLARLGGVPVRELNLILFDLELSGRLRRHDGSTVSIGQ